jgi:hypothetical protein
MLRPLTGLLALAALSAVPVAATAAGSDDTQLRVYVSNCQQQVYKPKRITLACADANFRVRAIRYATYGDRTATGTGTAVVNTCSPSCVAGRFVTYPVRVRLSRVTQCGDSFQFRRVAVTFTKRVPKGMKRTDVTPFPCANAPTSCVAGQSGPVHHCADSQILHTHPATLPQHVA